jgi:hypothetical protein
MITFHGLCELSGFVIEEIMKKVFAVLVFSSLMFGGAQAAVDSNKNSWRENKHITALSWTSNLATAACEIASLKATDKEANKNLAYATATGDIIYAITAAIKANYHNISLEGQKKEISPEKGICNVVQLLSRIARCALSSQNKLCADTKKLSPDVKLLSALCSITKGCARCALTENTLASSRYESTSAEIAHDIAEFIQGSITVDKIGSKRNMIMFALVLADAYCSFIKFTK